MENRYRKDVTYGPGRTPGDEDVGQAEVERLREEVKKVGGKYAETLTEVERLRRSVDRRDATIERLREENRALLEDGGTQDERRALAEVERLRAYEAEWKKAVDDNERLRGLRKMEAELRREARAEVERLRAVIQGHVLLESSHEDLRAALDS
jgi:hypothetical protein